MTPNEYQKLANRTCARNHDAVRERFSGMNITDLVHAQIGISGESGEFSDAVKRILYYGRVVDSVTTDNLKEELGDLLWYIALGATAVETTFEQLMIDNIEKLKIRYPEKFTEEHAKERLDKVKE